MSHEGYVLAGLLIVLVVVAGQLIAGRLRVPDAVVLVLLGFAVSYLPGMREIRVAPEVVLLVFLPPLIYSAAFFSSPRDLRRESGPIITLAVGATLVTAFAIAGVTWLILPQTGWAAAVALGAAVAPTDAVSASAVLKRVGAPRRVVTVLEGESLINDGVALTLFSLALTAMATPLTALGGAVELVRVVAGGLIYGALVALVVTWSRKRLPDGNTQLAMSLVTPFIAYIPAELLGFSGVLAAVVAGFYLGTRGEGILPPRVRATGQTVWQGLVTLLESVLFVLLGLQLHEVVAAVAGMAPLTLALGALAVIATAVAVRLLFQVAVTPVMRHLPGRLRMEPGRLPERVLIGWSGMRGAISLAIALSLPETMAGEPFTDRSVLIFLAAAVVLATLVGQGMSLPAVIRRLGVAPEENHREELARAQTAMARAALTRIDELVADDAVDERAAEERRRTLRQRTRRWQAVLDSTAGEDPERAKRVRGAVYLDGEIVRAQREALTRLYRESGLPHDVFRALLRELDLREPPRPPEG